MKRYIRNKKTDSALTLSSDGFTIVELMVATTVFSIILLLCTYGVLQVSRSYYKGVTLVRTQNTTRAIMDEVSNTFRFGGASDFQEDPGTKYCLGKKRFTYQLNKMRNDTSGVIFQSSGSGCETADGEERIEPRMRLQEFSISKVAEKTYEIKVEVASGDDEMLDDDGECIAGAGSEFCAVSRLETIVKQR